MEKSTGKKKSAKEIAAYLVCGVLTTVVSVGVYHILFKFFGFGVTFSAVVSVVCAKIFAYLTNKFFVFESRCASKKELGLEVWRFVLARGLSGVLDVALTKLLSVIIPEGWELAFTLGGCDFFRNRCGVYIRILPAVVFPVY